MKEWEGFLGGVSAAEPLVDATLRGGPKLLEELDADIVEAVNANDPSKEGRVE